MDVELAEGLELALGALQHLERGLRVGRVRGQVDVRVDDDRADLELARAAGGVVGENLCELLRRGLGALLDRDVYDERIAFDGALALRDALGRGHGALVRRPAEAVGVNAEYTHAEDLP